VLKDFFDRLKRWIKNQRKIKPLVSTERDVKMLTNLHGKRIPKFNQLWHSHRVLSKQEKSLFLICFGIILVGLIWYSVGIVRKYRLEVPAVGGKYTEAVVGSPQLVNPIFSSLNDVDVDITRLVFTGLMKYNQDQELVPDLAESFELSEDKKTYIFKLRRDVVWHDGTEFTARDVVFTIATIQDPLVNSPLFVSFQGVGVEALDNYTVQFELKESFAAFASVLTVGILPEHAWFDVLPERLRLHRQNIQPVGTGPFRFKKLTKDDTGFIFSYQLERNENFYDQPPYIEDFVFQFFGEFEGPSGAIAALRGGQVDGLSFVPHDLREKVKRKHINLHTLQLPQYTALFYNQKEQAILKEDSVRSALALAIDKDRILREALIDEGQIIHSPILPGSPGYLPELEKIPYDVGAANELLDKSWKRISAEEYRTNRTELLLEERKNELEESATSTVNIVDEEGNTTTTTLEKLVNNEIKIQLDQELNEAQIFYRQNDDDQVLTINLVSANTQEYKQAVQLIAGFWQEIGVITNITLVETKDVSRTVLKDREYDVLLYGMILGSDPDQYPFWHSSQAEFPGLNLAGYINRSLDTLLQGIRDTEDVEKIIELSLKFQETILKDKPAVFLYTPTYTYATIDKLKGIDVTRIFHPADRFSNVTLWYVNTKGDWRR
jgi:peptide/nickel transport system substrate-binding protein